MNTPALPSVREIQASVASKDAIAEALRGDQPMIFRGLISDWPIVMKAREGVAPVGEYLKSFYSGAPVTMLKGAPAIKGKFFYRDDMSGVNFDRSNVSFDVGLQQLMAEIDNSEPAAVYMQSLPVSDFFPKFVQQNNVSILDSSVIPRIWIGNAITVQTHFDLLKNIACLVTGKRRFTLFPPEQLPNLYIGPLDFTLSGPPVSMVRLENPDLEKYPRFTTALAQAQVAEMNPGDALYIPFAWWHHVESLTPFNILVNYWWTDVRPNMPPFDSLLHAIGAVRELPEDQRKVWRSLFDYYAFKTSGEPLAHLPPEKRGLMGTLNSQRLMEIKKILQQAIMR